MRKAKDLTGRKFGRLEVVERAGVDENKRATWLCKCRCGNTKIISAKDLHSRKVYSCGCLRRDLNRAKKEKDYERLEAVRKEVAEYKACAEAQTTPRNETLCWTCYHATNPENKCPWTMLGEGGAPRFEPVPGWKADPIKKNVCSYRSFGTFLVRECPLYEKDIE